MLGTSQTPLVTFNWLGALVGEGGALGIANKRSTKIGAWKARGPTALLSMRPAVLPDIPCPFASWHDLCAVDHSFPGWNGAPDSAARLIDWKGALVISLNQIVFESFSLLRIGCSLCLRQCRSVQRIARHWSSSSSSVSWLLRMPGD